MSHSREREFHPDLHTLLLRFHEISGRPLESVWRVYDEHSLDKIILNFSDLAFVIEAEPYDDTIKFEVITNKLNTDDCCDASGSEPWKSFLGKPFGWGWLTINQMDALDGILISFSGITPQVLLTVMASSIKEHIVLPGSGEGT